MNYETIIGLEVHVQLKTRSKLFCGCATTFGSPPNSNICPVCTGYPGVLPVLNKKAIYDTIKAGVALNCKINKKSVFARKQYFYPDLPKNYQISQYELPVAEHGELGINIEDKKKKIGITRIHLEEDAGKLLHALGSRELEYSLVDLNRTGIPLMEIVSEPDMRSPKEAYLYLSALKSAVRYLEVSDCDMEKGSLRCDANISLRPAGAKELGTKAELKNMNSFKGVREALEYEVERQKELLDSGNKVIQETRLWNEKQGVTESMRSKEEAHDYRYFPEPDLVPFIVEDKKIRDIKKSLPELPEARFKVLTYDFSLSEYDAEVLISEKERVDYYDAVLKSLGAETKKKEYMKLVANWVTSELLGKLNATGMNIKDSPVSPEAMAQLMKLINSGTISGKIAKKVFEEMFQSGGAPDKIVKEKGLVQISDESTINKFIDEAITANSKAVKEYKEGNERAVGAIIGFIMKKTQGKANPQLVNKLLKKRLKD